MKLKNKRIGFAFTGSFCTFKKTIPQLKKIVEEEGGIVIPIMSFNTYQMDTKFGNAKDFIKEIEDISQNKIINSIQGAEPIGPKNLTDIMIVAPCSGNTIAKLANGVTDTPVLMAVNTRTICWQVII